MSANCSNGSTTGKVNVAAPAAFALFRGGDGRFVEETDMADDKRTEPEAAGSSRRRRSTPTIDLTAAEVAAQDASAQTSPQDFSSEPATEITDRDAVPGENAS